MMEKIVIAGGTGLLGEMLIHHFKNKVNEIVVLSRIPRQNKDNIQYVYWDGKSLDNWMESIENTECLINLAGKSVDCRYTSSNKELIYSSRLDSTYILGEAIQRCKNPPRLWINSSSATIYKESFNSDMDEEGELGNSFSEDVCRKWENVFTGIEIPDVKKVIIRTGIVIGGKAPALQKLKRLCYWRFGKKLGEGNQMMSWLHEHDFCRMIEFICQLDYPAAVYNLTAPEPVSNLEFMTRINEGLNITPWIGIPRWLLEIGARIIGTETELILKSRRVVPRKILDEGYVFIHPELTSALSDIGQTERRSLD